MGYKEILQKRQAEAANNNADDNLPEVDALAEIATEHKFFAIENVRGLPSCIDLRLSNGSAKAVPYSFITEIGYNAADGIEIVTGSKKISIVGRNLQTLYNHLIGFRIKYIQANIGNDLSGDKDIFVKGIKIEEI